MHGMRRVFIGLILFLPLVACVGGGQAVKPVVAADGAAAGSLNRSASGLTLNPVPLYGMPELLLGAVWQSGADPLLQLCDQQAREPDAGKPLVLYLDGEHEMLRLQGSDIKDGLYCSYFSASPDQLNQIASRQTVMLRIYFAGQAVEQRVSGTISDYFSRPKMFGPQQRLKRFVDALQDLNLSSALVDG